MMRSPSTTTDAIRWEQRAEFSSRHPVPEPCTSAGSFLRVGPATVCAAERAMGWGKHFKIRPPDKDDAFPMEDGKSVVLGKRGDLGGRRISEKEQHLRWFIFESWAGHGACRRACDGAGGAF